MAAVIFQKSQGGIRKEKYVILFEDLVVVGVHRLKREIFHMVLSTQKSVAEDWSLVGCHAL